MIKIRGLNKYFGDYQVLKDIDLDIGDGKRYGIIGRSGAGKSTLLRCINGLEAYDSGSLTVDNIDIKSLEARELMEFRKGVGMIFQQFSLLERLDVYENISLPLRCWKYSSDYIDKRVRALIDLVGLSDKARSRPKELSGGQKQRVAIARALALNPKILLSDEATSALDPKTARSIIDLMADINQELGITIVFITHEMQILRSFCQDISIMEAGRISTSGPVEDIFLKQPRALVDLIGSRDFPRPSGGRTLEIVLVDQASSIVSSLGQDLAVEVSLLATDLSTRGPGLIGSIIVNIPEEAFKKVTGYLEVKGFKWQELKTKEDLDE